MAKKKVNKIGYFTKPELAGSHMDTIIGIKLTDVNWKDKYAKIISDDVLTDLLYSVCSPRSGLIHTPYPKGGSVFTGEREWTYIIGIKPLYEFQEVNSKGNIRALCGNEGSIITAKFNERPHFNSANDARMFIATRIAKFSNDSVCDIAKKVGCYTISGSKLMATPEIRQEVRYELFKASADEPTGLRLKALLRGVLRYMDMKYSNDRVRQVFELLAVGFTDDELQFYDFTKEEIVAGHQYSPSHE